MKHALRLSELLLAASLLTACERIAPDTTTIDLGQDRTYRGTTLGGKADGYGTCTIGDSLAYAGKWKQGVRSGRGIAKDTTGRTIVGLFSADTLTSGIRHDSLGTYEGSFNHHGCATGHGTWTGSDGQMYCGSWEADERADFGFALSPGGRLRVGEWRGERYLGERLTYTSDRIYGIDISRFQHDVGRKHYAIDWSRLRITHLGTISRKRVNGKVDYPISFIYIKASEGTTIRNPYYRADYAAARRQGIRVGSYHFFSTRTTAEKQARHFLSTAKISKGDFPPVLDVEPSDAQIRQMGGAEKLLSAVRTWLQIVEKSTGTRPVLYISQSFVNRYLPLAPDLKRDYHVWIARYGEYKPDVRLAYWQLCPDGRVAGIKSEVDINVFNGYQGEFDEFCRTQLVK